ncbi:hypothetical protein ACK8GE_17020 [Micromonosporaceae bacterium DT194]|uniref:YqeB family protein n=1 Tax=Melissospora conviva TaxID=3388432 RepID=UPI003C187796
MVSGQSRSQQLSGSQATVLGLPRGDRIVIYAGAPLAGLLLAFGLPWVANWLLQFDWLPLPGVVRLLAAFDGISGWKSLLWLGGGLVLGLVFAVVATVESLKLTLTDQQLRIDKSGDTRFLARAEIGAVFLDGKELVLLDRHSREVLRDTHDAPAPALAAGFRAHGYPWQDRDPYEGRYHRWLPDFPELPPRVHALLATRQVALERKDHKDAARLAEEVAQLGYVLRTEDQTQYWRALESPPQ